MVTGGAARGGGLIRLRKGRPTQQDDEGSDGTTKENSSFLPRTLCGPCKSASTTQTVGFLPGAAILSDPGRETSLETGSWRGGRTCVFICPSEAEDRAAGGQVASAFRFLTLTLCWSKAHAVLEGPCGSRGLFEQVS